MTVLVGTHCTIKISVIKNRIEEHGVNWGKIMKDIFMFPYFMHALYGIFKKKKTYTECSLQNIHFEYIEIWTFKKIAVISKKIC